MRVNHLPVWSRLLAAVRVRGAEMKASVSLACRGRRREERLQDGAVHGLGTPAKRQSKKRPAAPGAPTADTTMYTLPSTAPAGLLVTSCITTPGHKSGVARTVGVTELSSHVSRAAPTAGAGAGSIPGSPGGACAPGAAPGPAGGTGGKPAPMAAGGGAAGKAARKAPRPPAGTIAPASGAPGNAPAPRPGAAPRGAPRAGLPRPRPLPLAFGGIAARWRVLGRPGREKASERSVSHAESGHVYPVRRRSLGEPRSQGLELLAKVAPYAELLERAWVPARGQAKLLGPPPSAGSAARPRRHESSSRKAGTPELGLLERRGGRGRHAKAGGCA